MMGFLDHFLDHLQPNAVWALVIIFVLLVIATLISYALKLKNSSRDYSELLSRIHSWWVMATLFAVVFLLSQTTALIFFAFISFLALKEYLSLIPTRRADHRVLFWVYAAIPFQYYWASMEWFGMFIIFIPVYLFLFMPMRMVIIGEVDGFLRAAGTLHWGVMITVFSLSHIAYLLVLPVEGNPIGGGAGLVIFLVVLTQLNDVSQYVWGKLLGRRKVIEKVSPNKTWEGFIGGVLTTTLLATLAAPWLTPLNLYESILAGLIIGMGGFIGDVIISAVKRDLKVKDSGNLLPGHGGILDRVDSLTYTAPLFFHYLYYLHY